MLQRRNLDRERVEHISLSIADRALVKLRNIRRVIGLEPNGILRNTWLDDGARADGCLQLAQLCLAWPRERREQPGFHVPELLYPLGNIGAIAEQQYHGDTRGHSQAEGLAQRLHRALVQAVKRVVANEQLRLIQ